MLGLLLQHGLVLLRRHAGGEPHLLASCGLLLLLLLEHCLVLLW